jgi:hypothetical protein
MPCLFAVFAGFMPRVALLFLLFFSNIFQKAFDGWFIPFLGIIFLPYTTFMYVFAAAPLGSTNFWGWFSVLLGLMLDLSQWYSLYLKRNNVDQWSQAY